MSVCYPGTAAVTGVPYTIRLFSDFKWQQTVFFSSEADIHRQALTSLVHAGTELGKGGTAPRGSVWVGLIFISVAFF